MVYEAASCPHQQLLYCYSNKLHVVSDVTDFAPPETAFGWVGMMEGIEKNLKSRCLWF